MDASLNEVSRTTDSGVSAVLWATAVTACNGCVFPRNGFIQNWMQMESASEAGKYDGYTCTAIYSDKQSFNSAPSVLNYKAVDSLADLTGIWKAGYDAATEKTWLPMNNDKETLYRSTYTKNESSTQGCAAFAPIYGVDNEGNPTDEALNEAYWAMKNGGEKQVWAGFKIFEDGNKEAYATSDPGNVTSIMYAFQDLGFVDPNPPVEEEETTEGGEEMGEAGASALLAAATALAVALVL